MGLGPSSSSGPVASRPPLAVRSASAASSTSGGGCRQAGFWGHLASPVCYMEWVACAGPFLLQALCGEVCGFSSLAPLLAGVSLFLHQELSLDVVISFHLVLRALLRSFRVSSPSRAVRPPSWALAVFLRQLPSSSFASLRSTPLRSLVKMVLFFVPLATAIPNGELQALSRCFSCILGDACLSLVFTFVAKCELLLVPSLAPWLYLCPTLRLVSTYVLCFAQFVPSAFSWTGRLPCSIAPAVFLSLRAARLRLFLWLRLRSSSGCCSCGRCCQA